MQSLRRRRSTLWPPSVRAGSSRRSIFPGYHCWKDNSGASFAEYALVLAIIGTAIALAAIYLGQHIRDRSTGSAPQNASVSMNSTAYQVRAGEGAFVKPDDMRVQRWYPLEFVAGPNGVALAEEAEGVPLTQPHTIFVSRYMRVTLLQDPNFQIRTKSESLQAMGPDLSATWLWDVKPKTEGTHILIAQVDVLQREANGRYTVFNRYSRRVSVRVGVGTLQGTLNDIRNAASVGDALTALFKSWSATLIALTALIAALVGVWSAIRRFRKHQAGVGRPEAENDIVVE